MNQNDLNRAVARSTGETISSIKRLGFLLADPDEPFFDPEDDALGPHVIDWDEFYAQQLIESGGTAYAALTS